MSTSPRAVHLHIGLHKTGTTYVQNVLRANREHVRTQGVDFPGGKGEVVQTFAVSDLMGRRPRGTDDRRVEGQWEALVHEVNANEHRTVLLSDERLSIANPKQIRRVVGAFSAAEVHVIVTARDLARVSVSAWQEEIKNANTWSWRGFSAAIKDPSRRAVNPARNFWLRQDLVRICDRWAAATADDRVHVVTVPPSGSSPDALLARFCSVVGIDPARLVEPPVWSNENVGAAATEVLRRLNGRLDGRLNQRQYDRVVKQVLVTTLARRRPSSHLTVPADEVDWMSAYSEETIIELKNRGYRVVGDLDDLRPAPRADGQLPDDVEQGEVLEAALEALAALSERHATAWWHHKKPDSLGVGRENLSSRTRGLVFRGQRRVIDLADRSKVASGALDALLKVRDRSTRRRGTLPPSSRR